MFYLIIPITTSGIYYISIVLCTTLNSKQMANTFVETSNSKKYTNKYVNREKRRVVKAHLRKRLFHAILHMKPIIFKKKHFIQIFLFYAWRSTT